MLSQNESQLIELFNQYYDKYEELNSEFISKEYDFAYSKNARLFLNRGALCPSPVIDIVIGGASRGKVTKRIRGPLTKGFIYYFQKGSDQLEGYDYYAMFGNESMLYQRAFIKRKDNKEHDITFAFIKTKSGQIEPCLKEVVECIYDILGRITSYYYMFTYALNAGVEKALESVEFQGECYTYDESSQLLDTASLSYKLDDRTKLDIYKFKHNDEGCLISYQNILAKPGSANHGHEYPIARSKQRKV